jgi:UDP-N-acetylmuramate-alanine ligase
MNDITRILTAIEQGDQQAVGQLWPLVYEELRKLAVAQVAREGHLPAPRILAVFEPRSNTMKLGAMKAQLPWSLEQADLSFCHSGGLSWNAGEALAPMGAKARVAATIDELVRQVVQAARPGDHIVCMSNGGFGDVHAKLLHALEARQNG